MRSEIDLCVLEFESRFWKYRGAKEAAIRNELGLTPTRYYQILARLLDDPAAHAHAPQTINRLRETPRGPRARPVDGPRAP